VATWAGLRLGRVPIGCRACGGFLDNPPPVWPTCARTSSGFRDGRPGSCRCSRTAFENVQAKGDYDSEGRASIVEDEQAWALVRYVVDKYHNSGTAAWRRDARKAWLRLSKRYGVVPPRTDHGQERVRRQGAEGDGFQWRPLLNLFYQSRNCRPTGQNRQREGEPSCRSCEPRVVSVWIKGSGKEKAAS